jgi:hypothetical protein
MTHYLVLQHCTPEQTRLQARKRFTREQQEYKANVFTCAGSHPILKFLDGIAMMLTQIYLGFRVQEPVPVPAARLGPTDKEMDDLVAENHRDDGAHHVPPT